MSPFNASPTLSNRRDLDDHAVATKNKIRQHLHLLRLRMSHAVERSGRIHRGWGLCMSAPSANQLTHPARLVLLVGTRHDYQRPGNPGSNEFHALISAICGAHEITVIAEEISLDALSLYGATQSVCKQVADALDIGHCYCDLSREEQKRLGIAHPGKSDPSAFSPVRDDRKINPEVSAADAVRERRWLEHVLKLGSWPVLFVCGAHHIHSFRTLLQANRIIVHVLCTNWAPDHRLQRTRARDARPGR